MLGLHTTFLVLLSIVFMVLDSRVSYFQRLDPVTSLVALPLQYTANAPVKFIRWMGENIGTQQTILEENAKLRAQQLLLQAKIQRMIALENENIQLRMLLRSAPHVGGTLMLAEVIGADINSFTQRIILNKGSEAKVYEGQPVLDADGIMGQVIKVTPVTSQVLLLTDLQSAIPVQDSRNGIRGIAAGTGKGNELQLLNVPNTVDIQKGDLLVTSGLEERFPQGYPVGIVKFVNRDPELHFASIIITPTARIDRSQQVLLVWPANASTTTSNKVVIPQPAAAPAASSLGNTIQKPSSTPQSVNTPVNTQQEAQR